MRNRLILVLGMHRGGTSAVAGLLETLGVSLGERLIAPAPENPGGFYEDFDFLSLHEEILAAVGASWHSLAPLNPSVLEALSRGQLGAKGRELLRGRLAEYPVFLIKDPRMSRLLPFWRPIMKEFDIEVSCVVALRNPVSVARSLGTRNGFSPEESWYLWGRHLIGAIRDADPRWPRLVVHYDSLLEAPAKEIARILSWSGFPKGAQAKPRKIVELSLRHHHVPSDEAARISPIHELWSVLEKISRDEILSDGELDVALTRLEDALDAMTHGPAFRRLEGEEPCSAHP